MTRFQKLSLATVITTVLLVTVGVIVRATDSGMGCPDWPLCYGQLVPPLDDYKAWLEWIHRTIAAVIGFMILGVALLAWKDHRHQRSILLPSIGAVLLVAFQAWLGRETVRLNNSGESVTAHLAAAMALLGLLVYVTVRAFYPARIEGRGASQRFTLLAAFSAAATYALLLFGSNVTAMDAALVFPDWPLMNGTLLPISAGMDGEVRTLYEAHALHRYVAVVVGIIAMTTSLVAIRTQRRHPAIVRMAIAIAILYPIQALIGGAQVLTLLAEWTQTLHLALGAIIWGLAAAMAVTAYYEARTAGAPVESVEGAGSATGGPGPGEEAKAPSPSRGDTVRAYIALTKPRIIELLLITTIPAMVLATRDIPAMDFSEWLRLAFWTMLCGSLAAGSANAINQYLDRDIDLLMSRTRKRPLPAHSVTPENAVVFGIVLGVISIALMAWFVNLVAAFLTLLAIAFYVFVYTLMLKRTTPQNIVIGGAAGALPPVIGWAAVTGTVEVPALLLFALVFYWTPPHFWALALRIRKDYEAARVPMLPVVKGVPETARQIGLYTILLVAISLVFFAVAQMGLIYLAAAVILGAIFLWRAYELLRQASSPEGSLQQAIRLYKYSISYLTLLFVAVAVDSLVLGRIA
ncbi:MAG TPA: heme o synthase [Candidatus Limnocylindrales bacterium]|nr:heme o synthase [Candidatus Limnocylindrales bacterium]